MLQGAFHLFSYTLLRTKTKLKSRIYHVMGIDSIRQMQLFSSIVEATSFEDKTCEAVNMLTAGTILTVTYNSSEGITLEIKLNIHVLAL